MTRGFALPSAHYRLPCLLIALFSLGGCGMVGSHAPVPHEKTLADLKPAQLPDTRRALPQVSLQQVAQNYRNILSNTRDPEERVRITQRLADLQMLSSEQVQLAAGQPGHRYFDDAIKAYRDLLAAHPHRADNDRLLYQLSKAYDMDGRSDESLQALTRLVRDYPQSPLVVEAQFRRGELLFARNDYAGAEAAYAAVTGGGVDSPYYQNALYMRGWAQFKQSDYTQALASFTQTLDRLWPAGVRLDAIRRTERELVDDTLRVMSLSFANLDGADSITATYQRLGERHYIPALYTRLGQLYLQQKRYRDAAQTYRAFALAHPRAPEAPAMYVHLIDAYAAGNFPTEVLAQKAAFVQRYGIHGDYQQGAGWQALDDQGRAAVQDHLRAFLTELAQYHHALAQHDKQLLADAAKHKRPARDADGSVVTHADMVRSYRLAGDYYREYVDTFPQAPDAGEKVFLLAETRFEAADYAAAIDAYEAAAYQYSRNAHGADAGYSAILAYPLRARELPAAAQPAWQQRRIASELRFAKVYTGDARAVTVQAHAAQELFDNKDYAAAIAAATPVTRWQPPAPAKLQRSAWLIIAHGHFEQQQYARAEQGYTQALALIPANDPEHAAIVDRLAASVYKQGERKLAAGDKAGAAQEYLRVTTVAPTSSIRANAQYDAATQFMATDNYRQAIGTLTDLRSHFPNDPLSAGVAAKLAVAYQHTGQPAAAAAELTRVADEDKDPEARREALQSAADLYRQAGDRANAIARYQRYVEQYPAPFPAAMEARYQLAELYRTSGDESGHRQWLQRIIAADAAAGSARTDRSRFLAAQAQDQLADIAFIRYMGETLTLPLKQSMQRKKADLDAALAAYQHSADYGIQKFATKAAYRIGQIYANLAQSLVKSQRPPNLSALEREQYELLLEEQADPFVDKAIKVHEGNAARTRDGIYDEWVQKSFEALAQLLPARYRKHEARIDASDEIN